MDLSQLLNGVQETLIVDHQWGDTGKGKATDILATSWAQIAVRGTGGANAGHTIEFGGQKFVFHLMPCSLVNDANVVSIIGSGVAFDIVAMRKELGVLIKAGLPFNNLQISHNARLVLPWHKVMDRYNEQRNGGIGTTGQGIGPVYADYTRRKGLFVNDLLNPEVFARNVRANFRSHSDFFACADQEVLGRVLQAKDLGNGREGMLDLDAIIEIYLAFGREYKHLIRDTDTLVRKAFGKKRILGEGAQGTLLGLHTGSYPFVTCSEPSAPGLAEGMGLAGFPIGRILGVFKGPYMTKVGDGPFPTEIGGEEAARWCRNHTRAEEAALGSGDINSSDPMVQNRRIREIGDEFGATTGRLRRIGWLDLVLLRHALTYGGRNMMMTKPDVLDTAETINVCDSYRYDGDSYWVGGRELRRGDIIHDAIMDSYVLGHCTPMYTMFPGWLTPTCEIRDPKHIPSKMKRVLEHIELRSGAKIDLVSVGPDREQLIVM